MKWYIFFFYCVFSILPCFSQEVSLSLKDYEELRRRAAPPQHEPEEAVVPFVFNNARWSVAVTKDMARIHQALEIQVFDKDWITIPLPSDGSYTAGSFEGGEGRLTVHENRWQLRLRGKGLHKIELESVHNLIHQDDAVRPTYQLSVHTPKATVINGTVKFGQGLERWELVAGGFPTQAAPEIMGFSAQPGDRLILKFEGPFPVKVKDQREPYIIIQTTSLLDLYRDFKNLNSIIRISLVQGQVHAFKIKIPEGYLLQKTLTQPKMNWKMEMGHLIFQPDSHARSYLVEINLRGSAETDFTCPILVPEKADRVQSALSVVMKDDGLLELTDPGKTVPFRGQIQTDWPQTIEGPRLFLPHHQFPPTWKITWPEKTPLLAAHIPRMWADTLVGESGHAVYRCWFEVRNAGLKSVELKLPVSFRLLETTRNGKPLIAGRKADAVLLPLAATNQTQMFYFSGTAPLNLPERGGEISIAMPGFAVPVGQVFMSAHLPSDRLMSGTHPVAAQTLPLPAPEEETASEDWFLNGLHARDNGATTVLTRRPFETPIGFSRVYAHSNALAALPSPLRVQVSERK